MPMIGLSNSQSVKPSALNKERWGALSGPWVIKSLRLLIEILLQIPGHFPMVLGSFSTYTGTGISF